ncbi:MAG: YeeE/YedE family protein [Rhodobacteraceae bacterium]|nr:YeeE/YedE family protein [Paracoccaceae bacterium]
MIDIWKEAVIANPAFYIGWGGLLIGLAFGYIVFRTNFCTMGSISDILSFGNYNRFRAWLLAAATAIIGVLVLERLNAVDAADSMYLAPSFGWLGNVVGGLIFGFGMVFAGGCMSRNLVRTGGGDLRSGMVVIVAGLAGYMTIGGLFGPARVALFGPFTPDLSENGLATQGLDEMLAAATGMAGGTANLITVAILAGAILIYCFASASFRASPRDIIAGIGIGLCVVAGWLLTGLAQDDFADVPVALGSLTFVRPAGDTLDYLMRATAFVALPFAVVTTLGTLLGAFLGAIAHRRFALATFNDTSDTLRNLFGAMLMGIGGVLALGCTVGQAVTGLSTLAAGSFITFIFIVIGGIAGMKTMEAMA